MRSHFEFTDELASVCQFRYVRRNSSFIEDLRVGINDLTENCAMGLFPLIELRDWLYAHTVFCCAMEPMMYEDAICDFEY